MSEQEMIDAAIPAYESGEWAEWLAWLHGMVPTTVLVVRPPAASSTVGTLNARLPVNVDVRQGP